MLVSSPNSRRSRLSPSRGAEFYCVVLAVALLSLATFAPHADAWLGFCSHCGCSQGCQKVCRLVQEEKKVPVVCWGSKCEDFCIPGPSKPGCKHCDTVCDDDADPKSPCVKPKKFIWTDWIPGCASIHTKQKLMKKTVVKTIPSYKWVVEDLCGECETKCQLTAVPLDAQIPTPPATSARLLPVPR